MSRIFRNALLILVLMAAFTGIWNGQATVALITAGLLAMINFALISRGVNHVLQAAAGQESSRGDLGWTMVTFLGRLVLMFAGLFAIIHFSLLSPLGALAALAGLSIFILSGILEALLLLCYRKT